MSPPVVLHIGSNLCGARAQTHPPGTKRRRRGRVGSVVPTGLVPSLSPFPALKGWAKLFRPTMWDCFPAPPLTSVASSQWSVVSGCPSLGPALGRGTAGRHCGLGLVGAVCALGRLLGGRRGRFRFRGLFGPILGPGFGPLAFDFSGILRPLLRGAEPPLFVAPRRLHHVLGPLDLALALQRFLHRLLREFFLALPVGVHPMGIENFLQLHVLGRHLLVAEGRAAIR